MFGQVTCGSYFFFLFFDLHNLACFTLCTMAYRLLEVAFWYLVPLFPY